MLIVPVVIAGIAARQTVEATSAEIPGTAPGVLTINIAWPVSERIHKRKNPS